MRKHIKPFIAFASIPIMLLILMGVYIALYKALGLPPYDVVEEMVRNSFSDYGYQLVFLGAIAEGLLLASWYLPGSVVIVMGVAFAKENGMDPVTVLMVISAGFMITALFNYALGRYGWYRLLLKFGLKKMLDNAKRKLEKHGPKIILGTYIHPNLGSITATSAGILQIPFKVFLAYSIIATLFWNGVWGTAAYYAGERFIDLLTFKNLALVIVAWTIVLLVQYARMKKKELATDIISS